MSYKSSDWLRDWQIDEVVIRSHGALTHVIGMASDNLSDEDIANVFAELRILAAAGCPPDREHGSPRIEKWKKYTQPKWRRAYMIYVLKPKPGRFRLYFYVHDPKTRQLTILYVVEKKTDKRDPNDFGKCCRILDKLAAHTAQIQEVDLLAG